MVLKRIPALTAAALLLLCPGARAQTGALPKPSQAGARWIVDARNDTCLMARQIADGPTTFAVMRYPGANYLKMRIVAPSLPRLLRSGDKKVQLTLSPGSFSHEGSPGIFTMGSTKALQFWLPAAFLDALAGATSMRLLVSSREVAAYDLPQAAAVVRALAQCERNALLAWGAHPAGLEPGAVRPKVVGTDTAWVDKVVMELMRKTDTLDAVHRLSVGVDGRATGCAPIGPSLSAAASAKLCAALMTNARYTPALDPRGTPIGGVAIHELSVLTRVERVTL